MCRVGMHLSHTSTIHISLPFPVPSIPLPTQHTNNDALPDNIIYIHTHTHIRTEGESHRGGVLPVRTAHHEHLAGGGRRGGFRYVVD